jgi:hypothetical protein
LRLAVSRPSSFARLRPGLRTRAPTAAMPPSRSRSRSCRSRSCRSSSSTYSSRIQKHATVSGLRLNPSC